MSAPRTTILLARWIDADRGGRQIAMRTMTTRLLVVDSVTFFARSRGRAPRFAQRERRRLPPTSMRALRLRWMTRRARSRRHLSRGWSVFSAVEDDLLRAPRARCPLERRRDRRGAARQAGTTIHAA
jgi:hypothetical protein